MPQLQHTVILLSLLLFVGLAVGQNCQQRYSQCGGIGFTGKKQSLAANLGSSVFKQALLMPHCVVVHYFSRLQASQLAVQETIARRLMTITSSAWHQGNQQFFINLSKDVHCTQHEPPLFKQCVCKLPTEIQPMWRNWLHWYSLCFF